MKFYFKKTFSTHACKTVTYESIKTALAGKRNKGECASPDHQFLTIAAYAHKRKTRYWRMFRNANKAWPTTKTSCNLKSIKITEIITKKCLKINLIKILSCYPYLANSSGPFLQPPRLNKDWLGSSFHLRYDILLLLRAVFAASFPSSRLNTTTYYMYFVNIILANQMPHLLVCCFKKRPSSPILQLHKK